MWTGGFYSSYFTSIIMLTVLTDDKYFGQILSLAKRFPEGGLANLSKELYAAVSNPFRFLILADVEGEVLRGFFFAALSVWNGERVAFVRGYAYDGRISKSVYFSGYQQVREWCKTRRITALLGFTQRPKGFIRRYGCAVISAVIRKELV